MNKFLVLLTLFMLALPGCGTKQAPVTETEQSLFNIAVEPVTEPQTYRYGPALGQLNYGMEMEVVGQKTTSTTLIIKYSILENEDTLTWHMFIPEWSENGKPIKPTVPLLDMTMNTNKRGIILDTDVSFPLIKAYNITDPKALSAFEEVADDISKLSVELPEEPIVTGDPITTADISSLEPLFRDFEGTPRHILEGEFTQNGVRYVSTTLDETISGKLKETGQTIHLRITARNIARKDNMETIYGYGDVVAKDNRGKQIVKAHVTFAKVDAPLSH